MFFIGIGYSQAWEFTFANHWNSYRESLRKDMDYFQQQNKRLLAELEEQKRVLKRFEKVLGPAYDVSTSQFMVFVERLNVLTYLTVRSVEKPDTTGEKPFTWDDVEQTEFWNTVESKVDNPDFFTQVEAAN